MNVLEALTIAEKYQFLDGEDPRVFSLDECESPCEVDLTMMAKHVGQWVLLVSQFSVSPICSVELREIGGERPSRVFRRVQRLHNIEQFKKWMDKLRQAGLSFSIVELE